MWPKRSGSDRYQRTGQDPQNKSHRRGTQQCQDDLKNRTSEEFFSQRVAERWNELPLKIKNAPSVTSFRATLRGAQRWARVPGFAFPRSWHSHVPGILGTRKRGMRKNKNAKFAFLNRGEGHNAQPPQPTSSYTW